MGFFSSLFRPKKRGHKMARMDIRTRFDLLGRTGQGSMSKVWRARDKKLGRIVCLKILDKVKTAKFEARFGNLYRPPEGFILSSLHHPNVVQAMEYGISPAGEQCIVMELIDGMGLNYLIETRSPSLDGRRIDYLAQMANAIGYIHEQGYLHRDICPRNAMVTQDHVLKMIDFGLSIPDTPDFGKPGNRTGTADYLAPELIRRMTTDKRVDLFALGVTAFETLTGGSLPWEKAHGSMDVLNKHINLPGHDPREYRPDLDDATVAFLQKSIARRPEERFQTAAEFRDALLSLPRQDW